MAAIYKSGSKWVIKTTTSTYNLDSGDCILTETTDGNYFQLKLNGETILNSSYTIVTNESGSPYSKPQLVALLDELIVKNATGLSGFPARLSTSVTRPADTADYAAGDAIGAATARAKQVSTITLTGTDGNADITGTGGLTKRATFNTSLTQTATNFVTDHAAAYLALDVSVVVTSSGDDIIFTAAEYDTIFIAPVIANVDESLSGTVVNTHANNVAVAQKETISISGTAATKQKETITISGVAAVKQKATVTITGSASVKQKDIITLSGTSGTANITGTGGFVNVATFNTTLSQTAIDFVAANAAEYATIGITATADAGTIIFEATALGTTFTQPVATNATGDLAGTNVHTAQILDGTANLTMVGATTKLITFNTDLDTTASDFVTAHAAYYTSIGITVTSGTATIIFEADVAGTPFGLTDVATLTGDLAGTSDPTTANVPVGTANVTGAGGLTKLITFDTDAATTCLAFKTANVAAYLAEGIVLTNSTNTLVMESENLGESFTAPVVEAAITGTVAGSVDHTVVGVVIGTATVTGTGDSKTITFDTDASTTALNFKTANEAYYATLGITLTNSTTKIIFTADVAGTGFTKPVVTVLTGDIAGALADSAPDYYANEINEAQIDTIPLTGINGEIIIGAAGGLTKAVTFDTDLTTTAANFVSDNAVDYLAQDIVLTSSANSLIFTAANAGTGFTSPTISGDAADLSGTIVSTPNVSLAALTISNTATANGGGGFIMEAKIETDAVEFAGKTVRVWLFNETPTSLVGDNVAYVSLIADSDARMSNPYFDVVFDALLVGSDSVVGKVQPNMEFVCGAGSKDIVMLLQTLSAVTTPTSGGVFRIDLNVVKI